MKKSNVKKMKLYNKALQFYCKQLEKALDKACEELEKCEKDFRIREYSAFVFKSSFVLVNIFVFYKR